MNKLVGIAVKGLGGFFMKKDSGKDIVKGVEVVNNYRLDKRKISLVIISILALLLAFGKIDVETFIELFNEVE